MANQLNIGSLLFMNSILPAYAAAGGMPSIVLERPLFYREQDDGCYPVVSYIVYKLIEDGAIGVPVSLLCQSIIYFGVGLHGSFLRFWVVNFFIMQTGIALAYVCASVGKTMVRPVGQRVGGFGSITLPYLAPELLDTGA
jgi:hypothetical protein